MGITKLGEIGSKSVTIEENDVFVVNGTDSAVYPVVKCDDASVRRISGFVDRVVASNPGVGFVVIGEDFPKPDGSVLEVFVVPDCASLVSELKKG